MTDTTRRTTGRVVGRAARRMPAAIVATVTLLVVTVGMVGAPTADAAAGSVVGAAKSEPLEVVAAFYPLAFAAERVGGRRVAVTNLTPAGTEPHDLELTTKQRDAIEDAALVVVLGSGFQPAVEKAAAARAVGTLELLDRLPIPGQGAGRKVAEEGAERPDALDPHVWLDPTLMRAIVAETAKALTRADPRGASTYAANAARVDAELVALDGRFRDGLAACDRKLVVTAHEAFGYLTAAYGLQQEGVAGISPDVEPDPRRLARLADLVEARGVTTVFTEELVSPKIAQTLAREAGGLATAVLSPLEGLTAKDLDRGADYVTVMDRNLARLRAALGCR